MFKGNQKEGDMYTRLLCLLNILTIKIFQFSERLKLLLEQNYRAVILCFQGPPISMGKVLQKASNIYLSIPQYPVRITPKYNCIRLHL